MVSKQERYFSGTPLQRDPSKPLPGEVSPRRRRLFLAIGVAIVVLGLGIGIGLALAPETPHQLQEKNAGLQVELKTQKARVAELERTIKYRELDHVGSQGKLQAVDRQRHQQQGHRYAQALRAAQAQPAAELMEWFVGRWNQLLDNPQPDDRVGRRAAVLSLLVGGMAENLDPDDYVPWQAEFFIDAKWLGELHFDLDHDGLPGLRSSPNPKDGFADLSVCQIAMALNQSVKNARVLVMPDMRCDRPEARMSVFLQGKTMDDALNEFVRAVKREGFLAVERKKKGIRLILIGQGKRRAACRR